MLLFIFYDTNFQAHKDQRDHRDAQEPLATMAAQDSPATRVSPAAAARRVYARSTALSTVESSSKTERDVAKPRPRAGAATLPRTALDLCSGIVVFCKHNLWTEINSSMDGGATCGGIICRGVHRDEKGICPK